MKKKVISILIIFGVVLGIIFSFRTYAGTGKLYTNLEALNLDGIGYGIGDPTNKGKYIWHMNTYDSLSGGLSEKQKNIYCLQGDYGESWESFYNSSPILEYNMVFDLQQEREELLGKIVDNSNDADEIIQSLLNVQGSKYREILWLLDNMYIKGENNKEDYLAKAGIAKDEYEGVVEYYNSNTNKIYGEEVVTEADIIAVQRVALWTFTNGGDFDKTKNDLWLQITGDGTNYTLLSDSREAMAIDLYNYLISSAKTGASLYNEENNYTITNAPVEVNIDGLTAEDGKYKINAKTSDSSYIIGPIIIDQNNDFLYKISMTVTDENDVEIDSSRYSFTDSNGNSLGNVTIKDFVGKTEGFYIKVDKSLATKVNVQIQIVHYNTTKNLWLQGTEDENEIKLNAEQPIAEFSREEETTTMSFIAEPEVLEFIEIPITKEWKDSGNQDGIRPDSIDVNLNNGDTIVETVTLNEANNWTHVFTNLPKKENGVEINYAVEENEVPTGYTSKTTGDIATGYTITNTHIAAVTNVAVTKVWEDSENQDGIRPNSVNVNLKNGNTTIGTTTLNKANNWTYTFTNLPKKANGVEINYTVEENSVPTGYTSNTTGDMSTGYIITNTHIVATTNVKVTKVWEDSENQDGIRPASIDVNLKKGNTRIETATLNETNNWTHSFTNLPKKENGVEINYTVEENETPTGYTSKTTGDMTSGYTITNTHIAEITEVTVEKVWEDSENQDRIRPDSVEIDLKNGNTTVKTIILNETNNWTHTFTNLPKKANGVEINYTVKESEVPTGYATQTEGDMTIGYIITNTHIAGTKSVRVKKVWEDSNNKDGIRPNSIEIYLKNGNTTVETVTLNEANNWTYIFANLPQKINETEINYTVEENEVPTGYTSETIGDMETGYTITNTHIPEKTFDLALRKYITKINNNELTTLGVETRIPQIDVDTIETNKTATYKHRKNPLEVEENDIITYAITIYNEGDKPGYASQIIDQLPEGLIYNPSTTIKSKDKNGNIKNTYTVVDYKTSINRLTLNIVNSDENPAKELQPYDGEKLDSETIEINCKVVYRAKIGERNILTNVAWINEAYDTEDSKIITTIVGDDRDSEPGSTPKVSKDNMKDYKGSSTNPDDLSNSQYFYEGQQDDDDFEKIYVKTFDMSLRKFIISVNGVKTEISREPVVEVTPLQNGAGIKVTYTHTKTPLALRAGDTVIYTLRVYNEGEIAGFASEVKDYLSPYLQYVKNSAINNKYKWSISEDGRIATTKYLADKEISEFDGTELDYEDLQIECKISEDAIPNERITNIAEISEYKYGNKVYVEDGDSKSNNITENLPEDKNLPDYKKDKENNKYVPGNEDDDDFEKVYVKEFDLSLRKFITQVQDKEITSRIPQVKNENGVISYEHPKDALAVHVGETIIYTLRIYNEGEIAGFANEITDDIPEYLEYLPENSTNVKYMWKMYDENENETQKLEEAVKVKTTYLSKENGENNLLAEFDGNTIYYRDIKIAFKVKDPNSNTYIITNHAQISNDTDEDENEIKDKDSYTDKWNDGEDDQDIENVKVEYFDLSILKFVSKVIVQENGTEKITETGYNGHENPEPVVKVELRKKKLKDVVVKFGYGITVTNEGDVPGYATEIKDYVPDGLKFEAVDNQKWTDEGNNVISTKQLENTLLQPGESKTIEVILTWINDPNNMALKTNTVEISKDKNEYDVPDRDSIIDNKKDGEDDIDTAKVILAIATGNTKTYFTLTLGLLIVIATGIFLIKKFVI